MSSKRFDVAIAGEINLDLVLYGLPMEMPTERELLAENFAMTLGSSSAILAHNLAALGLNVTMTTLVGPDPLGEIALQRLREAKVDLGGLQRTDACNTGVTFILPHGKERHMITYPGTIAQLSLDHLDLEYLGDARHFHLSSLYLQTALLPHVPLLFRTMKSAGLSISLDTNDDPEDRWEGLLDTVLPLVDIFMPNEDEAIRMTRTNSVEEAIQVLGSIVPIVAIKCGKRGALVSANGTVEEVPGFIVTPVDTVGAGDSFNTGFLYGHLNGMSPAAAARCGNLTGALSTQRSGGTEAFRDAAFRDCFLAANGGLLQS
jgi:sugar/nucleoside kinase (ribokinase family)